SMSGGLRSAFFCGTRSCNPAHHPLPCGPRARPEGCRTSTTTAEVHSTTPAARKNPFSARGNVADCRVEPDNDEGTEGTRRQILPIFSPNPTIRFNQTLEILAALSGQPSQEETLLHA